MDPHMTQYTQIRAALMSAGPSADCCRTTGSLDLLLTGDVILLSAHHYEATGPSIVVEAICAGNGENGPHAVDDVTWHVSPEKSGTFLRNDAGMHFAPNGNGDYDLWAAAGADALSPRAHLVVKHRP